MATTVLRLSFLIILTETSSLDQTKSLVPNMSSMQIRNLFLKLLLLIKVTITLTGDIPAKDQQRMPVQCAARNMVSFGVMLFLLMRYLQNLKLTIQDTSILFMNPAIRLKP